MVMIMIRVEWKEGPFPHFKLKTPIFFFRKKKRIPHLVAVSNKKTFNLSSNCERLYRVLTEQNYYVTPNVKCGRVIIDLALIPYQIAIIKRTEKANPLKCEKFLRKKGWDVIFYTEEEIEKDFYEVVRKINRSAKAYLQLMNES